LQDYVGAQTTESIILCGETIYSLMPTFKRPLKTFLYYTKSDLPIARQLYERLTLNGVDVVLPDYLTPGSQTGESDDKSHGQERKYLERSVQEADTVLFCLSNHFNEVASLNTDWQFVLETALDKHQRGSPVIPIRLEDCNVPQSMKKWVPVNLFEDGGYERMMVALKLQADMVKAELTPQENWKERFVNPEPEPESDDVDAGNSSILKMIGILAILVVAVMILVKVFTTPSVQTKLIPVDDLAEKATQNVQLFATNRAATVTANIFSVSDPLTQTAVYINTTVPLTKTAVEFEAHITHTITPTPTATITPTITLTVVSRPRQIIAVGNVSMVLVPGGSFIMGNNDDPDASPAGAVQLETYYIDQYEVTNALYQQCVQARICLPPLSNNSQTHQNYYGPFEFSNSPVINVDWNMARTYCEWRDARLPTEAEWEKAARGTDELSYPWGNEILCPFANYTAPEGACVGDTQPVNRYDSNSSIYDAHNMAGNVAEWVSSLYSPYPYNASDGREDPASTAHRVVRGGSWASPPNELLTYHRLSLDPSAISIHGNDLGFRCAMDAN